MKKEIRVSLGLLLVAIISALLAGGIMVMVMDALVVLNVVAWAATLISVVVFVGMFAMFTVCLALIGDWLYSLRG